MLAAILRYSDGAPSVARCHKFGPGAEDSEGLALAFENRLACDTEAIVFLKQLWRAYSAPEPAPLNELATIESTGITRWCAAVAPMILDEYPSLENGLSRTEELLLRKAADGGRVVMIVAEALGEHLGGDQMLFEIVWKLVSDKLLESIKLEPCGAGDPPVTSSQQFRNLPVQLSALGREVLLGREDYVKSGTVDRWVGVVHLTGANIPWRLDRATGRIKRVAARDL